MARPRRQAEVPSGILSAARQTEVLAPKICSPQEFGKTDTLLDNVYVVSSAGVAGNGGAGDCRIGKSGLMLNSLG